MRPIAILLCLFLIPAASTAQCPRTVADAVDSAISTQFWHGTDALAARIPVDGYWYGMGPEHGYKDKLFIRSAGYRPYQETSLEVRGRRLDGNGQLAQVSRPTNAHHESFEDWVMLVGISLPSAGCWEFEVSFLGQELKFVVEVKPQAEDWKNVAAPPNKALRWTTDPATELGR